MNFHTDHRLLLTVSAGLFLLLSLGIAVLPALEMQRLTDDLPAKPTLSAAQANGLRVYVSEGCVACHTQQVRNLEMDHSWGKRPSVPSDYFASKKRMDVWRQSPSLLGSERTGPDLTSVGERQTSTAWHLLHLYNPRIVVKESIMPGYPWLFVEADTLDTGEDAMAIPAAFLPGKGISIVPTEEVLDLVAYLQSLRQTVLDESRAPGFLPLATEPEPATSTADNEPRDVPVHLDGAALYNQYCSACHQPTGEGVPSAFPPLKGSPVVNDPDPTALVTIIQEGYDTRPEYAVMPAVGQGLTNEQIVAIVNHERSSWGNQATSVSLDEVASIRALLKQGDPAP